MKELLVIMFAILAFLTSWPFPSKSEQLPCSKVLKPVDPRFKNAQGSALIYKVQSDPAGFERINISILAVHLPSPSFYLDYDQYEGLAFIPQLISWRPSIQGPGNWVQAY